MSENTSPANEPALEAAQPAATNQDNASVNKTDPKPEATSTESKSEKSQPAKKEPKQGVRDTRTNKSPESADQSQADSKPEEKGEKPDNKNKDGGQPQQANQQNSQKNNTNNNRNRGRRGRKTNESNQNHSQQIPIKLDPKAVSKKAWKIFLAEVSEEGLALIGDKEGKELTKRSFRLGEIFHEEEQRRINLSKEKCKLDKEQGQSEKAKAQSVKKKTVRAKKTSRLEKPQPSEEKSLGKTERKEATVKEVSPKAEVIKQEKAPATTSAPKEAIPVVDPVDNKAE